jgi:hypothetical protein
VKLALGTGLGPRLARLDADVQLIEVVAQLLPGGGGAGLDDSDQQQGALLAASRSGQDVWAVPSSRDAA